ncbi:SKP1-like protein 14-like [Trifolium medium]|uniref:SKP1-like protein n=2 Tax=Trifolium TaxID=3898 RepID=A0A392PDE9_9FABA|nr:SKP1-like protein 14-like [Trifolium medium]
MAQEASSSTSSKTISLKTADGEIFEIEASAAKQMKTVQRLIDDLGDDITIPLHNVFSKELPKIIEYYKKDITGEITKDFEAEFVKDLNDEEVKVLFLAANYLDANKLFEFLSQNIADRLESKSVEYVRKYFGVENDFTPEEESKLREERAWSFRGIKEDEE